MKSTNLLLALGHRLLKNSAYAKEEFPFEEDDKNEEWDTVDTDLFDFDDEDALHFPEIENSHPFASKQLDYDKINDSIKPIEECINLIVSYVNTLKLSLKKFNQTSINELEENNQIIDSIKKIIIKENKLDKVLAENEPTQSVQQMEYCMDAVKDFVDDVKILQELVGYEQTNDNSEYFTKFLTYIENLSIKFIEIIEEQIKEYDSMDLVKKINLKNLGYR